MKLTMTPKFPEDNGAEPIIVEADSMGELLYKMIEENVRVYGKEVLGFPCVLESLAEIANGEEEYNHFDFSCPEDAFSLKIEY